MSKHDVNETKTTQKERKDGMVFMVVVVAMKMEV